MHIVGQTQDFVVMAFPKLLAGSKSSQRKISNSVVFVIQAGQKDGEQ
jgi:hypothetical protein